MSLLRSILLFVLAAIAEIGGAWLIWQGWREHRGVLWIAAGVVALGAYGFVAAFQPDPNFGRVLAAYGGIFIAGSLLWGVVADGFRPDRYDLTGAALCLIGVAVIMYAPRGLAGHETTLCRPAELRFRPRRSKPVDQATRKSGPVTDQPAPDVIHALGLRPRVQMNW